VFFPVPVFARSAADFLCLSTSVLNKRAVPPTFIIYRPSTIELRFALPWIPALRASGRLLLPQLVQVLPGLNFYDHFKQGPSRKQRPIGRKPFGLPRVKFPSFLPSFSAATLLFFDRPLLPFPTLSHCCRFPPAPPPPGGPTSPPPPPRASFNVLALTPFFCSGMASRPIKTTAAKWRGNFFFLKSFRPSLHYCNFPFQSRNVLRFAFRSARTFSYYAQTLLRLASFSLYPAFLSSCSSEFFLFDALFLRFPDC